MADEEVDAEVPAATEATSKSEEQPQTKSENITYEEGEAFYTDEATKYKYKWCKETKQWKPMENEHYKWCDETQKWVPKIPLENEFYRWCDRTNQWIPKMKRGLEEDTDGVYGYDEHEKCQTYTDKDGVVFLWDAGKKAWFPRVDDDFLAIYQMNYGFVDNTGESTKSTEAPQPKPNDDAESVPASSAVSTEESDEAVNVGKKRKAQAPPPKWFEVPEEQNTKVYVSNMPDDVTEDEFGQLMSKCGLVMKDLKTGKLKVKLYRDKSGKIKGDGLCHYIKVESVDLALNVLDGSDVRGKSIKVQRAEFQMRGEYNPALKPRMRKQEKEKQKKMQEKLFDWRPEKMRGERSKHERTVILKNLFEAELFDREVHLILDYQNDLREECAKCGTVRKVIIYDRHPEGIAQVIMADPEEADLVIKLMNGRMFGDRKLTAETWDGKTKYKIDESETARTERLEKWDEFLELDEKRGEKEAAAGQSDAASATSSEVAQSESS